MTEDAQATAPLVFIDTETTSLNRRTRQVWDVALIRREPDGEERTFCYFVEDVDLAEADPFSLRIGGFYDRHPAHRLNGRLHRSGLTEDGYHLFDEARVARLVEQFTRGAHLVGAVPSFDEETLAGMLWRHGLLPGWHYHLVDVEALAAGFLGVEPPWDSRALSEAVGVDRGKYAAHTALGDALWARDVYDATISLGRAVMVAGRESLQAALAEARE